MLKKLTLLGFGFLAAVVILPVLANAAPKPSSRVTVDPVCVQNAVTKRENAIIAGVDAFSTTVKSALQTRRDSLVNAWSITDKNQRRAAIKTAWDAFRGTWKSASTALRNARKAAWAQYRTDAKACHISPPLEERANESSEGGI